MKLLILAATGATGIEIVREAIELGHEVTVFVRSPERLSGLESRLRIGTGDLLNPRDLVSVARGQDAVLSTFGPRVPVARSDQHLLRDLCACSDDGDETDRYPARARGIRGVPV